MTPPAPTNPFAELLDQVKKFQELILVIKNLQAATALVPQKITTRETITVPATAKIFRHQTAVYGSVKTATATCSTDRPAARCQCGRYGLEWLDL